MRRDGLTTQRGFTLIETLVSLSLFVLAAAAVSNLLVSQIRIENGNANYTTAISLATSALENLRSLDYPSIPASQITTTTVGPVTYTVTSTAAFDTPATGMARITTAVTWTDLLGSQTYTVNAIYTDVTR